MKETLLEIGLCRTGPPIRTLLLQIRYKNGHKPGGTSCKTTVSFFCAPRNDLQEKILPRKSEKLSQLYVIFKKAPKPGMLKNDHQVRQGV